MDDEVLEPLVGLRARSATVAPPVQQHPMVRVAPLEHSAWMGGHGTEPYEQKTQQSPGFGRNSVPQPVHS